MNSFELNQLTPHIYWSLPAEETDRPVLGAIVGTQSVLMVDAGNSPAHASSFIEAMRSRGLTAPTYIALTHYHWDHVFGAAYLDGLLCAGAETGERLREMARLDWRDKSLDQRVEDGIEKEMTRAHLKLELSNIERSKLKLRVPDITFTQRMTINLGEINCQLITVGGDHTSDSTIIYIPEDQVVFLGDCLYSGCIHNDYGYTSQKLYPLLDALLSLDAKYYLLAHHDQPTTRNELEKEAHQFKTMGQTAAECQGVRSLALQRLEKEFGSPLKEDIIETLDAFLNGLKNS